MWPVFNLNLTNHSPEQAFSDLTASQEQAFLKHDSANHIEVRIPLVGCGTHPPDVVVKFLEVKNARPRGFPRNFCD